MSAAPRGQARTRAAAVAAVAAALALAAAPATPAAAAPDDRLPNSQVRERDLPMMFLLPQAGLAPAPGTPPAPRRDVPALDPGHLQRLRRASQFRQGGRPDVARDSLMVLDYEVPHHPLIVTELAEAEIAAGSTRAAIDLLRAERARAHDSLLASRPYVQALMNSGRGLDAVPVAIETWAASGAEGQWAAGVLARLAPLDPHAVTEAMRAACAKRPGRGDMIRGLAFLLARQGRAAEAAQSLMAFEPAAHRELLLRAFADEALTTTVPGDSTAALEALVAACANPAATALDRAGSAERALEVAAARRATPAIAPRVDAALAGVPPAAWGGTLALTLARALREGGQAARASAILAGAATSRDPALELERALDVARAGPPERALGALDSLARTYGPARFPRAEAEFWSGRPDSALAHYQRIADDPSDPDALAALDRAYLLEERPGAPELRALGALAWQRWSGRNAGALALADTLARTLPRTSPFLAHVALETAALRGAAGDWRGALAPLALVADSLPQDRLAPIARQRAGEAYLALGDPDHALAAFEECLARYPRSWNSPEVRRQVARLRKERRP